MGNLVAQTDSPVTPDSASIAAENAAKESLEIFTRNEIRLMDSLLNVWYVKRDLPPKTPSFPNSQMTQPSMTITTL